MSNAPTPLQISVMGRPVLISSADEALLGAIARTYAEWPVSRPVEGRQIRLALELGAAEGRGDPMALVVDGPQLRMTGAGVEGWADARSLEARCRIPKERPADLTREVTDTLLLFLLTRSGRAPVHAAGVLIGGTAVVLAGPSGTGKSTLSLAAMARGLRILSDDTVYIQLQPSLRIWGFPRPVHVFPADAPRFTAGSRLRAGKLKAAVALPPHPGPPVADHAALVLLERGDAVRLEPIERSIAIQVLSRLEPGFDLLAEESAAAVAALARAGAWRLTLSRDPAEAIEVLLAHFGPGSAEAAPT